MGDENVLHGPDEAAVAAGQESVVDSTAGVRIEEQLLPQQVEREILVLKVAGEKRIQLVQITRPRLDDLQLAAGHDRTP